MQKAQVINEKIDIVAWKLSTRFKNKNKKRQATTGGRY